MNKLGRTCLMTKMSDLLPEQEDLQPEQRRVDFIWWYGLVSRFVLVRWHKSNAGVRGGIKHGHRYTHFGRKSYLLWTSIRSDLKYHLVKALVEELSWTNSCGGTGFLPVTSLVIYESIPTVMCLCILFCSMVSADVSKFWAAGKLLICDRCKTADLWQSRMALNRRHCSGSWNT